ncbi:MAG: subtilin biosynthesis sensor protein SpaK [Lachnospiraceae bacterium]|nr:subtilin biosynthesis sensor protein SpaK [Lachnospiraceae bacterium]
MSYTTFDELENFEFGQAYVGNVEIRQGIFHMVFDNVLIKPENSRNRDIRTMRCNEMLVTIENPEITEVLEEGFKEYDANGKLMRAIPDRLVEESEYPYVWEQLLEGEVYSVVVDRAEKSYQLIIDSPNYRTYRITLNGTKDTEDWERFLNL